jgi:hypothetical protein
MEEGGTNQWLQLVAKKISGDQFRFWILSAGYPSPTFAEAKRGILRYVLQEGAARALEFRDAFTHQAVLPSLGAWRDLVPRPEQDAAAGSAKSFPQTLRYLGHHYILTRVEDSLMPSPPEDTRVVELLSDVLIGVASNTRQKDERRRYDNSDYELVRLAQNDYHEMFDAGMNCFKVDLEQLPWVEALGAFYWGLGAADLPYPELLYRSTYLGPTLFLDEPAVCTRDFVIRPRLQKENSFRKEISPELVFDAFRTYYQHELRDGAPRILFNGLKSRADVDLGTTQFNQQNLFSWETMAETAAYQLSQDPAVPAAMVFEPPGRVGTFRTLPELDMTYGCQIPVDNPKNLIDIIYGFLRGAARLTNKSWGTSIYGSVDRTDAFWFLTHAYDLGATRFFFWDNAKSACVPYGECLALARNLRAHAESYPQRDLRQLNEAAEVAILLPPGYGLGHVQLGKGSLWGLGELNLERTNHLGVKYRTVMGNFFTEIERCLRMGVSFDLLWNLPERQPKGYRELVRVRDDGKVQIQGVGGETLPDRARTPIRPPGPAPTLRVELSANQGSAPLHVQARAQITETSAPVYYTYGTDSKGVYHNTYVTWEIYGPEEEDYRFLSPEGSKTTVKRQDHQIEAGTSFTLNRSGNYRLRAATVDLAGRSTVAWSSIVVPK